MNLLCFFLPCALVWLASGLLPARFSGLFIRFTQVALWLTVLLAINLFWLIQFGSHWQATISAFAGWRFQLSLQFDQLTWLMLVVVSFISAIIHRYSARYLLSDINQKRFLGQLSLLTLAVFLLVSSGNLLTVFFAWQWIGLCLYLLLNHYHYRLSANRAAKKKFMVNRLGDICFLVAVVLMMQHYHDTAFAYLVHSHNSINVLILGLVFVAIMTKTAQFPFHFWLLDTVESPTPVSALMHAGVINAGGFLLAKLGGAYAAWPILMAMIFTIGLATAMCGKYFMSTQVDIKKRLACSTMGQMGYMILQCGLGCFSSAIFHLIMHGFFKASLFLSAGNQLAGKNKSTLPINCLAKLRVVIQVSMTIILSVLSFALLSPLVLSNKLNPLLLIFSGITVWQLTGVVIKKSKSAMWGVVGLLAIAILYGVYWFVLEQFLWQLHAVVFDGADLNYYQIGLLVVVFAWPLVSRCFSKKSQVKFSNKSLVNSLNKLSVEEKCRQYFLYPIRMVGGAMLSPFWKKNLKFLPFVAILLLGVSFYFSLIEQAEVWMLFFSLLTLFVGLLMANRLSNFRWLLTLAIVIVCAMASLCFSLGSSSLLSIGVFYLVNLLPVWFVAYLLLRYGKRKNVSLVKNKLPWVAFYLSVFFILMIGLPGSASFITEFYVFSGLMSHGVVVVLFYGLVVWLLALVVMHALQIHIFNPKAIGLHQLQVGPFLHVLSISVIALNLINGFHVNWLLEKISPFFN